MSGAVAQRATTRALPNCLRRQILHRRNGYDIALCSAAVSSLEPEGLSLLATFHERAALNL